VASVSYFCGPLQQLNFATEFGGTGRRKSGGGPDEEGVYLALGY
jgi:hypothetical protein